MTPWQSNTAGKPMAKRMDFTRKMAIAGAWWNESFARHKRLPRLQTFMEEVQTAEEAGIKTSEDLVRTLKQQFGVKNG